MPIVRKVMNLRTSRAICLPKSWLEYFEKEAGLEILEVAIEVDRVLTISPIFLKQSTEPKTVENQEVKE
jgi:hypothetical protein